MNIQICICVGHIDRRKKLFKVEYQVKCFGHGGSVEHRSSDEVERRIFLLEALVDNWWLMASASSLTNECSESVSVSDDGRFLDGSAHIVVGPAQLVGELLNLGRRILDVIVDD